MKRILREAQGHTIFELTLTVVIMGIVIVYAANMFTSLHRQSIHRSLREKMKDDASFALDRIAEDLEQAGALLPQFLMFVDTAGPIVDIDSNSVRTLLNTDNIGEYLPYGFRYDYSVSPPRPYMRLVDTVNFAAITDVNLAMYGRDSVVHCTVHDIKRDTLLGGSLVLTLNPLTPPLPIGAEWEASYLFGDTASKEYFRTGDSLMYTTGGDTSLLAENVSEFTVEILDSDSTTTTTWADAVFGRVSVTVETGRDGKMADTRTVSRTFALQNRRVF
jgi:hypothetical protein